MNIQTLQDQLTDEIYVLLFGKSESELRQQFGVTHDTPDDDNIRDCMGTIALKALNDAETLVTQLLKGGRSFDRVRSVLYLYLVSISVRAQKEADLAGVDLLTGKVVEA